MVRDDVQAWAVRLKIPWYNYRWWGCAQCCVLVFTLRYQVCLLVLVSHWSAEQRTSGRVMNSVMSHWVSSISETSDVSKYQSTFSKVSFQLTAIKGAASGVKCCFCLRIGILPGEGGYLLSGRGLGCNWQSVKREKCQQCLDSRVSQTKRYQHWLRLPPCLQLSQIAPVASDYWLLVATAWCSQGGQVCVQGRGNYWGRVWQCGPMFPAPSPLSHRIRGRRSGLEGNNNEIWFRLLLRNFYFNSTSTCNNLS